MIDDRSVVSKVHASTKVDKIQIEFYWKIEHFSFCSKKQEILESPTFSSEKPNDLLKWKVRLYTRGINERYKNFMGLFLVLVQDKSLNKKSPKEVFYSFCILNAQNQRVNMVRSQDSREFILNDQWGYPRFLSKNLIETSYNDLVPNDQLTILVELTIFGSISASDKLDLEVEPAVQFLNLKNKTKDRTGELLIENNRPALKIANKKPETDSFKRKDFDDFLLNGKHQGKYSDMILVSSDGQELPVHRVILANESPIFLHKFDSLQQTNRLELKNFDAQTIVDCLRKIQFKSTSDKLLHFTDVYQLNELKQHLQQQMINKIAVLNAARYFEVASRCNALELKQKAFDFLKSNFHLVSETEEWKKLVETQPQLTTEVYKQILIDK